MSVLYKPKKGKENLIYWLIGIIVLIVIVFFPILNNEFVNYDDDILIYENELIKQLNGAQLLKIFQAHLLTPFYMPFVYLSFAVEYYFFKLDPFFYHLDNLLLHATNTILVFVIALVIIKQYPQSKNNYLLACYIALIFGVHPMKVESVAWATERKDLLSSFFFLSSFLCYIYYVLKHKYLYIFLGSILFLLGILSKSMAITLPFTLFIVDYLLKRKISKKLFIEKLPYFLVFMIGLFLYGILSQSEIYVQGLVKTVGHSPSNYFGVSLNAHEHSLDYRIILISYRLSSWLVGLIFPYNLSIFYPLPSFYYGKELSYTLFIYPFMILLVGCVCVYMLKYTRVILGCFLFFFVTISPVLYFSGNQTSFVSDRYLYIPSIGIFYLIGLASKTILEKQNSFKPILSVILLTSLLFLSVITHNRCKTWKNSMTLLTDAIAKFPNDVYGYLCRGEIKSKNKDFQGALKDFDKALELNPDYDKAVFYRGNIKCSLNNYEGAINDYNKAIEINPQYSAAYYNRGLIKAKYDYHGAIIDYNNAIELNPNYFDAYNNRGIAKYYIQDYEGALKDYNKAIELKFNNAYFYCNRGKSKINLQDYIGALNDFTKTIELKPDYAEAYYYRGATKLYLKDIPGVCDDLQLAVNLGYREAEKMIQKYCKRTTASQTL